MTDSDDLKWPKDEAERRKMARGLFGMQLVSTIDYWVMLGRDDLNDTHQAPWAKKTKLSAERTARRAVFATLSKEQKAAVADLLFSQAEGILHSVCCDIDQFQGCGLIMSLLDPLGTDESRIQIQPGDFLDMHQEQLEWLEEFSMIYGKEENA